MNRVYQEYTSRSTWKVIDAILEDAFNYTTMQEWKDDLIRFDAHTTKSLVNYLNQSNHVYTDTEDVDWQQVADELNNA